MNPEIIIDLPGTRLSPKARPRLGRRGVFSPTSRAETDLAWLLRSQAPGIEFSGRVSVKWIAWGCDPLADIDNCEKTLFDAMQKAGLVRNDRQVRESHGRLEDGKPRLFVMIRNFVENGNFMETNL